MAQRTALITGAGQSVGLGIARRLGEAGHRVVINDIDRARAEAAAASLQAAGIDAIAAAFDVSDLATVTAACDNIGAIDILVNNVGNAGDHTMNMQSFRDMPVAHWEHYFGTNLYGVLNCTKAVLDGMCDRGWGRIITISSDAGRVGLNINVSLYGTAKAGAAHFMRHLSQEVAGNGVTANVVSLGLMNNVPEEFAGPIIRTIPCGRLGTPEDAGAAVTYLASEDATWITGQTLVVNGGSNTF